MEPRLSVVTLGVDNLERSLRFYRDGLGLGTAGIIGEEFEFGAVVFIDLQPGLRLDTVMRQAASAGATIVKPAEDTFWGGYAGYFQDPDEHLWEVVWNPSFGPGD